ncbi:MAG TPA: ABC transporter permease [Vicinamibacterales bacterium]|nr:ABC transporter permease [Vicinamibacterales bacterium]
MSVLQDLRYAFRQFAQVPGFAIVAVLTLAVGIGATTAVFSVINAVLLRPVHAPSPDSIVRFIVTTGTSTSVAGVPEFEAWRRASAFEAVAAHRLEYVNVASASEPQQIAVARVTKEFFELFQIPIVAGRAFTSAEDRVGGPHVVVLSHEFWRQHFAGNAADVVGQSISLGNARHEIVGVVAAGFDTEQFDAQPAVWVPFQIDPNRVDAGNLFTVTGRLRTGVGIGDANANLAVALATSQQQRPGTTGTRAIWSVEPLRDAMVGNIRASLLVLFGAVSCLLLIASANVANLSLARADVRAREMAIRSALGASRHRIVSQVLTESVLLTSIGGMVGLLAGVYGVRALLAIYPSTNPYRLGPIAEAIPRIGAAAEGVTVDWRVFVFAVATCVSTAILFGLWPGLMLGRVDVFAAMKAVGGLGRRHTRRRAMLVVAEVALALMLLVGAMLLIRSSVALRAVDPGFNPVNVITTRTSVTSTRFETRAGLSELTRVGIERLRALPGIVSASATCCMPLETVWQLPFVVDGRPPESLIHNGRLIYTGFAGWTFVAPGYFDVLNVPVLRGRDFTNADTAGAPGVVVINEEMARRYWRSSDPIGDRLIVGKGMRPEYDDEPVRQIVGIVGNVRDTGLTRSARPAVYVPIAQEPDGVTRLNVRLLPLVWMARTADNRAVARTAIERAVTGISGLAPARTRSMEEIMSESTARSRFNTWLMSIFGGCALLLAAIGVYGLMAYSVQQRTREIGIRIALGADRREVRRMVLRDGLTVTSIGIALGLTASFGLARSLSALLFQVSPHDAVVFLTVPILLAATASLGIVIPSRRAMRVNPLDALRAE